jgi:plasmid stabilization system protein ParE
MKRLLYSEFATDDLKRILDYITRDKPIAARSFVDAILSPDCRESRNGDAA